MLAESLAEWVFQLLSEGRLSRRKIARLTGVSRGTVGAIARGRRPLDLRPKCADFDPLRQLGPPARCRGCGGMVYMPCLLCRVRVIGAIERRLAKLRQAELSPGTPAREARSVVSQVSPTRRVAANAPPRPKPALLKAGRG